MSTPHDHTDLPADLLDLARSLDALAERETAASGAGLPDRVWSASRAPIVGTPAELARTAAGLEALACSERAAAPADLEPSSFELSREAIAGGLPSAPIPALRICGGPSAHAPASPSVVVHDRFRFVRRFASLAAALTLAGVGVAVFLASRPSPVGPVSSDVLAERLDRELSSLFEAVDLAQPVRATVSRHDTEFEVDQSWLEAIFAEESL
ncbi:MAG: hypothetical protein ACK4WH_08265 [Phycisphaerales bacterium]